MFTRRSSAKKSVAHSCPANLRKANTVSNASQAKSVTLSETRVQAKLAKHKFAQKQAEQQANQRQIDFEREVARQHRELDKRREEAEAREKQLQEDAAQKQLEIKRAALERFVALGEGHYERLEGLEQLRFLENGMRILAIEVPTSETAMWGIDTPEDATHAETLIAQYGEPVSSP